MAFLPRAGADPKLIVGPETHDDAGVYRLSETLALVQTLDVITPIVDDPHRFGRVAAANSLSDVWAMGGTPITAMNIACYPVETLGPEEMGAILAGAAGICADAGTAVVGGHTVEDDTLKFGLSVTGTVDPQRTIENRLARPGDALVLTKAIGTGIVTTALKKGTVRDGSPEVEAAIASMETLNRAAGEAAVAAGVRAGTDVTGFGLIGHALNIARGSDVSIEIDGGAVPLLPGTRTLAAKGICTGGARSNAKHYGGEVDVPASLADVVYDPQTSGGLLLAIAESKVEGLLAELTRRGVETRAVIGRVVARRERRIVVR